ncbi:MAG TPA: hypothetical protein VIT67_07200 [Povalibacter sp.]
MAEENPFAKYVKPAEENPFAKYVRPVEPDAVPPQDPTEQMFVAREAIDPQAKRVENLPKYYGEMIPMAADAATFGLGNRGIAYGRSVLDGSGGGNYASHIAQQNEYLKRLREADPDRAVISELLGGVGGGAGLARAGITLAKPGVGWISRAVRGGTEGALQGAAQGAGQSYGTLGEKAAAAGTGAAMGGTFGVGIPLAASGGSGVKTLFDITKGNIPKYPPSLLRAVEADRAGVSGGHVGVENLPALGPDAMLPDAGPSMLRAAAAAKTTGGPGSTALETNLRMRNNETIPRLERGIDQSFGPDVIPAHVTRNMQEAREAMSPEWNAAFQNARAVDTEPVANWLQGRIVDTRVAQPELQRVRNSLNIHGTDQLDPHPRTLHETRMLIDEMLEVQGIPNKTAGALRDARRRISEELHDKVPGMANLDARYAELSSRTRAFERGQELFDTGRNQVVRPAEWVDEKAAMAAPKGGPRSTVTGPSMAPAASEAGTRAELGRVVGTGADDLGILERKFGPHNWATQNLITQFGVRNVEDFQQLLRTNRTFRESYNKIVHGSKTADTLEGVADTERGYFNMPKFTPSGMMTFVGDKLAEAQQGYGAGVRNRIAEIMATRGNDPTMAQLRRDLLNASTEQARKDITRSILETGARLGVTSEVPRATRR